MKKFKKAKSLLFGMALGITFCFVNTDVYAKTLTKEEIPSSAYVIGTHVFTRNVNETTGYEGRLTTNLIMLASQTIESNQIDNMIIYYKLPSGSFINGLTGETIEAPESFEINYTDLQLEEENSTVTAPKAPIISLVGGALSIDEETDMMNYQLDIYVDNIEDKNNKVDGVYLTIVDNDKRITTQDLKIEDFHIFKIDEENIYYDSLIPGKEYHRNFISFESEIGGYYGVCAMTYVLDSNGKKIYDDGQTCVNITPRTTLPYVQIINNYSNPEYISVENDYYTYRLGIEKPIANVFKYDAKKFAYSVNEVGQGQVGIFGLDEEFTITIKKNSVKKYYAEIGYYDKNGDFIQYVSENDSEYIKYFTIDTRELTAPIWDDVELNFEHNSEMLQIRINTDFYAEQSKDSLDYNRQGTEFYEIIDGKTYKLVESRYDYMNANPTDGVGVYVARVFAYDTNGKKVYSKFSEKIEIVKYPIIEASEIKDNKATITVINASELSNVSIKLEIYGVLSTGETVLLKSSSIDETIEIEINDDIEQIYARAVTSNSYSSKSNKIELK